jgi:diphthine synthase
MPCVLYIIGLGLEEGDISLKGLKAANDSDEVYVESYTSFPYETNFNAVLLPRKKVEGDFLIKRAKERVIALLVPGDPLFATTHISLVSECGKAGIPVEVVHAPSVVNALSRTGLSPYKFGRTVTLSEPVKSDAARIRANLESGLHTLCLLDPKIDAAEGLRLLKEMGFSGRFVVCERLGTGTEKISYGDSSRLAGIRLGKKPHCIVVPAELQFFEEEFLQQFSMSA